MNLWWSSAACILAAAVACILGTLSATTTTPDKNRMGWKKVRTEETPTQAQRNDEDRIVDRSQPEDPSSASSSRQAHWCPSHARPFSQNSSQFHTVDDIPKEHFDKNKSLYAFVERVVDGDTVRVRHLPGYNWRRWKHPSPLATRGIADQTLSVRLYGIDCPELAKFGKPSQPYGREAKEHTSRLVLHRVVKVTLLRKDQYRRAVARVETVPSRLFSWVPLEVFRPKDLSVSLAAAGLAELYTGGGAEYCVRTASQWTRITSSLYARFQVTHCLFSLPQQNNRAALERRIDRAKRKGRGMWALGDQRVSAADYKRGKSGAQQQKTRSAGTASAVPLQSSPSGPRRRTKVLDAVVTGLEIGV
jgi:endonuclease YncB( thermonuclease family)